MTFSSLGLLGLFLGAFLSATFIPFSSDIILIAFYEMGYDPVPCIALATIGNTLGGFTNYFIGRGANNEYLLKKFKVDHKKLEKWERRIGKWGYYLGLISWVPIVGEPMTATLGFFKLKFWPLALMMFVGKMTRYIITTLIYFSIL